MSVLHNNKSPFQTISLNFFKHILKQLRCHFKRNENETLGHWKWSKLHSYMNSGRVHHYVCNSCTQVVNQHHSF